MRNILLACLFILLGIEIASATTPVSIHKSWTLFKTGSGKKEMCYIASLPTKKSGDYNRRGEPYVVVSRGKGADFDEVSVSSGFMYNPDKDVEISISKRKFPMFTNEDKAWAYDRNDDVELVKQMKGETTMIVTGYSNLNFTAVDTYSLIGFTSAYNAMIALCK